MSVEMVRLGDVAGFVRGVTFKPDERVEPFTDGSIVCFRTANIQQSLDESDLIAIPQRLVKNEEKRVKEGDILVSSANSWNLVGKCCYVSGIKYDATIGGFISLLRRKNDNLDPKYLYYWMASDRTQATLRSFGNQTTNISNLKFSLAENLLIPLPSLERQREIAAVLDKVDELRAKRRQSISKLEELLQSTFLEMFGDPVENPKGWEVRKLGEGIHSVRYGTGSPPEFSSSGFPFVRATNIKAGRIENKGMAYISEDEADKIKKCKVKYGNILIVRSGVNSGESAFVDKEYDNAYAGYDMIIDLPINCARYVNYFINSPFGKRVILPMTRRGGQPHLNSAQVQSIPVYDLPVDLIDKFANILESTEKIRRSHLQHLQHLDTLYSSLQAQFFGAGA